MSAGTFRIKELLPGGTGEVFEWVADSRPRGGARAAPHGEWTIGGKMRTVRTDYPGALYPTEQVLGPRHEDQTFDGRWDDRYNYRGYAVEEMRRFDEMVRRGNRVRISFQEQVFEGLITGWEFPYRGDWLVRYHFTFSVHGRPDDPAVARIVQSGVDALRGILRSPQTVPTPEQAFDGVDLATQAALEEQRFAPRQALSGDRADTVDEALSNLVRARNQAGSTLDIRDLSSVRSPFSEFMRMATQFRVMRSEAFSVLSNLSAVRSDLDLDVRSAMNVLSFECWSRGLRYQARLVMGSTNEAARLIELRAKPPAVRTYRPFAGESLYSVSRRFYGTPHAWGEIYERNALTTFTMTGNELLVVPERGAE
jgi:hypothetical protein